MIHFLTKAHPQLERIDPEHRLGRLLTPRHFNRAEQTASTGRPWAADNDAFNSFDEDSYVTMLDRVAGLAGCRFVVSPDVVGDAEATLDLLAEWSPRIRERRLPVALALQDGLEEPAVPWSAIDAVFVGGSTEWKMGRSAAKIVAAANRRGQWAHMGRVNSTRRAVYARSIGCDSIDGTMVARFTDTYLERGLSWTRLEQQLPMEAM